MADGLDIVHRLPQLWARVEAGQVRVYLARLVARKTRDLTPERPPTSTPGHPMPTAG